MRQSGGTSSERLEELLAATEDALAHQGISATFSTHVKAITASSDGGVLMDVVLMLPAGYLAWFGQLLAKKTNSATRNLVQRIRKMNSGDLVVVDGSVRVVMEPGLPDDAILQLADPLPTASSGELRYDRAQNRWVDATAFNEGCD